MTARLSALGAVVLAVGMGLIGLGIGLWVGRDRSPPRPAEAAPPSHPERIPETANRPTGLAYLPADTNVAFVIRFGPLLGYAARTGLAPDELLTRMGLPARVWTTLTAVGVSPAQVDHLAGGTVLGDGEVRPRLTFALVLRQPLPDEDDFLRRLHAQKLPGGKTRYQVEPAGLPMTLARLSPTTWVFGFDAQKDLEAADAGGRDPGGGHLPAGLAEMIRERVPAEAAAWLATNDERWDTKPGVKLVVESVLKQPEWLRPIGQGRALMAAITLAEPPRLRLFVKATDDALGRRAREAFTRLAHDQAVVGGAGQVALLDVPVEPAEVLTIIRRLIGESDLK